MVQDVAAPVSITVIALDVVASPDPPSAAGADFSHALVPLSALDSLGAVSSDPHGLSATVSLGPDADLSVALNHLAAIMAEFETQNAFNRLRALLHFGTAFRAQDSFGRIVFQGSAVRSVGNTLKRSSLPAGVFATADFANYTSSFKGIPDFEVLKPGADGLCPVILGERRKPINTEMHSTDPQLVDWLKARLARDLGPFAAALVDNASHSTRTAKELAAAVGHEIVSPAARQKFDSDVFKYLRSRGF